MPPWTLSGSIPVIGNTRSGEFADHAIWSDSEKNTAFWRRFWGYVFSQSFPQCLSADYPVISPESPSFTTPLRAEYSVGRYDSALPIATAKWFEALEAAHEGVRFAVRSTGVNGQSAGLSGREKRQHEFLLGRRCASQLLAERNVNQPVGTNQDRSPFWPEGNVGSISHSDRWTIASVALAKAVRSLGVDTEPFMLNETVQLIAGDVATADQVQLTEVQGFDAVSALTLIFSAKESFYKCWYPITKRFLEFHDVAVVSVADSYLKLRRVAASQAEEADLTVHYHLSDNDVFTFAVMEVEQ